MAEISVYYQIYNPIYTKVFTQVTLVLIITILEPKTSVEDTTAQATLPRFEQSDSTVAPAPQWATAGERIVIQTEANGLSQTTQIMTCMTFP